MVTELPVVLKPNSFPFQSRNSFRDEDYDIVGKDIA
jgi:hypothetical protein